MATSNMDCLTPVDWPPLRDAARKAPVDGPMTANEHKAVITTRPEFKLCCVTTVNPMGLGVPTVFAASLPDVQVGKAAGRRGGEVPPRVVRHRSTDLSGLGVRFPPGAPL